ncbi:MAG: hypothetical protein IJ528_02475 [Bacteroidaceae bacterium]|nr:hypothetical protein [Bacteroidaceae bacterium]
MKTIVIAIASVIASISANAQNTTVYYSPVTTNMEVGLGFDMKNHSFTLSIIEESKDKVDCSFDIIGHEGQSILKSSMNETTVNVMPKSADENYYQSNYILTMQELFQLLNTARQSNKVVINGTQINAEALTAAIENIQHELRPEAPAPRFNPWGAPRFNPFGHRG